MPLRLYSRAAWVGEAIKGLAGEPKAPAECEIIEPTEAQLDADMHKHRCPACKTVWSHSRTDMLAASNRVYHEAHACPKCGHEQYSKYFGPEPETELSCPSEPSTAKPTAGRRKSS